MPSTCSRRWYVPGGPHSPQSPTPRDQDRRRHALHTLCTLLTSPEGALHAQPRVASFWVPLLQLLYAAEQWITDGATSDPRPGHVPSAVSHRELLELERDVAGVVGILGALAARSLAGVPVPSGIKGTVAVFCHTLRSCTPWRTVHTNSPVQKQKEKRTHSTLCSL